MKQNRILHSAVLTIVCLLLFSSCSTVKWVSIERFLPAQSRVAERVFRVAVVNNQPDFSDRRAASGLYALDSQAVADSLAQYLADSDFYDEVVVLDSVLPQVQTLAYEERELRPSQVKELARRLNVDMIVSVEFAVFSYEGYPAQEGTVSTLVKLYLPGELHPVDTLFRQGLIGWDPSVDYTGLSAPARQKMMLRHIAVSEAAWLSVPDLVPGWGTVELPYYTGANVEMRDAAVYLAEEDWAEVRLLWEAQLKHKNRMRRMEANLNMAVWHEIHDDNIDTAHRYAEQALKLSAEKPDSYNYRFISGYLKDLEARGRDLKRVKQQMHRFSDDF